MVRTAFIISNLYQMAPNHHFEKICRVSISILFLLITTACQAQNNQKSWLLALSKNEHTLSLIDPISLKVVKKLPVGEDPHEVIASADGKMAFVSIYGGGRFHELDVFDLVKQERIATVDTRPLFGPHGLAFAEGKCWFSAEGSKAIGRYDPETGKVDWSMGTGQDVTHMIYVTPNGQKAYTTNINSGTVSLLEANPGGNGRSGQEWNQTVVPVSRGCEGFDVTPDGKELWTASAADGKIFIVDLAGKKLATALDAGVQGANRLKFTPDGKMAFIASLRSGEVIVYDVQQRREIKRIRLGRGAAGILMQPDGSRAFVACSPDDNIAVINLKSLEVIQRLEVGKNPDGMAWAGK